MKSYRILSTALALCLLLGLTACGKKGETETASSGDAVSSQASDSSSSAAGGTEPASITIPFVVVPELTVRLIDMVQVVNVNEGSTLNVREGPGTNYGSIGSAQPGERFVYLGEADGGWRKIQFGDVEAYVSADYSEVVSVPG